MLDKVLVPLRPSYKYCSLQRALGESPGAVALENGYAQETSRQLAYVLNGHEFDQTLRDSEGQGSLACSIVHGVAKCGTLLSD